MLALHDPDTLLHTTVELLGAKIISALESPDRIRAIVKALESSHHDLRTVRLSSNTHELDLIISQTHPKDYTTHLSNVFSAWLDAGYIQPNDSILPECFRFPTPTHPDTSTLSPPKDLFARPGHYAFDMSSGIMLDSYRSILASANLAHVGVKTLFTPTSTSSPPPNTVLALTRPPGHHCNGYLAGGYCYINNAAVAISTFYALHPTLDAKPDQSQFQSQPPPRTAILDIDFHHGNGTQSLFYTSSSTLYVSLHGQDEFPYYTGSPTETGSGAGLGFNLNIPLPSDSSFDTYREKLNVALERIREHDPVFVVVSLGFDTFELDPLGKFAIESGDYGVMAGEIRRGLRRVGARGQEGAVKGEVKVLVVLEGGYVVERLGENLMSWLEGWERAEEFDQ